MYNLLEYIGYKLYSILSRILPLSFAYKLADLVGYLVFRVHKEDSQKRAIIMQRIYGGRIDFYSANKLVCKNFQLFNRDLVDFFRSGRLNKGNIDQFVKVEGLEYLDDALREGNGIVLASAHLGSWEMSGITMGIKGYPVYGMVWEARNRLAANLLKWIRGRRGVGTVEKISLRQILELLQKNKIIGIMLDIDGGKKGIPYSVWGSDVRLPRGPAAISLDTGAVILVIVSIREKRGGYRLYIEKPQLHGSEEEITIGIFEIIKRYVENNPVQWHWIRYFFEPEIR